ncbi:DNA glycosylase/AP lyase [Zopfochytrium polystomum]|nr:DNA glycosylase/AP lyase [Zopfochytrium polystomum]
MPELPEVERARRVVERVCKGKRIVRVQTVEDGLVYTGGISHSDFKSSVEGRTVLSTHRRGKLFYIELDSRPFPVLHFGMTGSIRVHGEPSLHYVDFDTSDRNWPPRFWKFEMELDDGTKLAFTDPRRLARIRLVNEPLQEPPIVELGPDPVHDMPLLTDFSQMVRKRVKPIKSLLLDQAFMAGIGNWIADEVLYQAHIHPEENTQLLTDDDLLRLHTSILYVIKHACNVDADCDKFPKTWLFHYRWFKGKRGKVTKEKSKKSNRKRKRAEDDEDDEDDDEAAGDSSDDIAARKKTGVEVPELPNGHRIIFETVAGRTSAIVPAVQILRNPVMKRKKSSEKKRSPEAAGTEGSTQKDHRRKLFPNRPCKNPKSMPNSPKSRAP